MNLFLSFMKAAAKATAFVPLTCPNSSFIGRYCNLSSQPCVMLNPCQNAGTCYHNDSALDGYSCYCVSGTDGNQCQLDHRVCKSDTCWNNGKNSIFVQQSYKCLSSFMLILGSCFELSSTVFLCRCAPGWEGVYCEKGINRCANITCHNNGVCRSSLLDYRCYCLTTAFSGRYCENKATDLVVKEATSKTLAYVAILAISSVVLFVIVLDLLKYGFKIDPVRYKPKRIHKKRAHLQSKPSVVQRFTYVQ